MYLEEKINKKHMMALGLSLYSHTDNHCTTVPFYFSTHHLRLTAVVTMEENAMKRSVTRKYSYLSYFTYKAARMTSVKMSTTYVRNDKTIPKTSTAVNFNLVGEVEVSRPKFSANPRGFGKWPASGDESDVTGFS